MASQSITSNEIREKNKRKRININRAWFFAFVSPWIVGFLTFTLGPMIVSFIMSFSDWDIFTDFSEVTFIGLENYKTLFQDNVFLTALKNTFQYTLIQVPLNLLLSLGIAYMLSFRLKGMRIFRTIYYLPSIVPVVASSLLFMRLLSSNGLVNRFLSFFGINGPSWLLSKDYVLWSFIFLALWGVGGTMILMLSAINSINDEMYEAAEIEGASRFQMFTKITIPQISPILFFNLITGIIGSLQTFTQVYMMTGGGPDHASEMIVPYLYQNAFSYYRMGYASAMAWVLFFIIMIFSIIVMRSSALWVFYEEEVK